SARGRGGGAAPAPERRPDLRLRRVRRPAVLRDGNRGRREPPPKTGQGRAAPAPRGGGAGPDVGRRGRLRPPAAGAPPGPEAGKRPLHYGRDAQDRRLWTGEV